MANKVAKRGITMLSILHLVLLLLLMARLPIVAAADAVVVVGCRIAAKNTADDRTSSYK